MKMKEKFTHRYTLLKDLPTHKAGRIVHWNGNNERFYFNIQTEFDVKNGWEGHMTDLEGIKFTLEQVQDKEW